MTLMFSWPERDHLTISKERQQNWQDWLLPTILSYASEPPVECLKTDCWALNTRVSDSGSFGWSLRMCISGNFQVVLLLLLLWEPLAQTSQGWESPGFRNTLVWEHRQLNKLGFSSKQEGRMAVGATVFAVLIHLKFIVDASKIENAWALVPLVTFC